MKQSRTTLLDWANRILDEGCGTTTWEQGFVGSILEDLEAGGSLSERQEEILERIYAERTP